MVQRLVDEPVVAFAAVGFEVGKPGVFLTGFETDMQGFAVETRRHPEPIDMVIRRHGVVAAPGVFIGRLPGIAQAEGVGVAHVHAFGLEMEPLEMVTAGIGFDCQQQVIGIAGIQNLDVAAVEVGADLMEVKATVIVWLPEYECCGGYLTQRPGKIRMQNCCGRRGRHP